MARAMKHSGIDWLDDIPAHWKRDKVSRIFQTIGSGTTPKSENPDYYNGDVHWIQSGDINGGFLTDTKISVTVEAVKKFSALRIYDAPFIVVAMYGASIGNLSLSHINACVNQACCVMRGGQQHIEYHFYALKVAKDYLVWKAVGGGQPNISQDTVKQLWLPVPPIDEQERIAAFLDDKCVRIDSVVEKTRASIEEYRKLKQAIITRAVTKGIRPNRPTKDSGIDWLGDIPADWEICKLRHIGSTQNGISKGGDFFGEGYPFVSYGDVYRNYSLPSNVDGLIQSTEDEQNLYSVKRGDIFFTRTSETIEEVGFSSVCEQTIPQATFAGFLIRVRPYDNRLDVGFSKYYFRSNHQRFYLVKQMNLVTRASLGQTLLKGMPVLLPPLDEQKEIAAYLDEKTAAIDSLVAKKNRLVSELASLKKSLIFEYVTGKKEVPK